MVVRALDKLTLSLDGLRFLYPSATVYAGTVLAEDVWVVEGAVVGKQPTLRRGRPRSATRFRHVGSGTDDRSRGRSSSRARGSARAHLGDQSCVRERLARRGA